MLLNWFTYLYFSSIHFHQLFLISWFLIQFNIQTYATTLQQYKSQNVYKWMIILWMRRHQSPIIRLQPEVVPPTKMECFSRLQLTRMHQHPVITYIVARLPYSIFQIQYIFQPDLLHMRCWDEQFWRIIILLVDYYTLPCQDWVSGHSDLRTDVAI